MVLVASCDHPPAPDAGGDPLYRMDVERGNVDACPDWDIPPHATSRLALAPPGEPEVAWMWNPLDEPMLRDLPGGRPNQTMHLSTSPDGSIWAVGPNSSILSNIDHDGHLRFALQFFVGMSGQITAPPRIAPDGSAYLVLDPDGIVRIDRTGNRTNIRPAEGLVRGGDPDWIAFGPEGRVYETRGGWLWASCASDPAQFVWRAQLGRSGTATTTAPTPLVRADGTVLVALEDGTAFFTIAHDGTAELVGEPLPYSADRETQAQHVAGPYVLGDTTEARYRGPFFHHVVEIGVGETWREPQASGSAALLLPSGRIMYGAGGVGRLISPEGATLLSWTNDLALPTTAAFVDGGGFIGGLSDPERAAIGRADDDGALMWSFPFGEPGDTPVGGILDVDGRFYAVVVGDLADRWGQVGQIVSIQTDALPTRSDFCSAVWPDGCNAHHSSWMHLYQPTPPTE